MAKIAPESRFTHAAAGISRTIRLIDRHSSLPLTLDRLARKAGLSRYHFLRTFKRFAGVTPHQYVLRARLRTAATRLASHRGRILDVALDCGFGDISNFNRAFRAAFGLSPRAFQQRASGGGMMPSGEALNNP